MFCECVYSDSLAAGRKEKNNKSAVIGKTICATNQYVYDYDDALK